MAKPALTPFRTTKSYYYYYYYYTTSVNGFFSRTTW